MSRSILKNVTSNERATRAPESKSPLTGLVELSRKFNNWYVRYPTNFRRLFATWIVSVFILGLATAAVLLVFGRFWTTGNWMVWAIGFPVMYTLLSAPRQYIAARKFAALPTCRISRIWNIVERFAGSVLLGGFFALVLLFGAVHGGTALTLFPIFSAVIFLVSILVMEPREEKRHWRILQWRYVPMRSYVSCNGDERRLVGFTLNSIFLLNRGVMIPEFWSQWTAKTRAATFEWTWLLLSLGSSFVVMVAILAPHCMNRTNQIGFLLTGAAILVIFFMIKTMNLSRTLRNAVRE
jgi:hypothetical protein